jgi:hypothetical protein
MCRDHRLAEAQSSIAGGNFRVGEYLESTLLETLLQMR